MRILCLLLPDERDAVLKYHSSPVGPVAGGIMGCFLVLAIAIYCYRRRVHRRTQLQYMTAGPDTNSAHPDLAQIDSLDDLDSGTGAYILNPHCLGHGDSSGWIEHYLSQEDIVLNHLARILNVGKFWSCYIVSVCMNLVPAQRHECLLIYMSTCL